MREIVSSEDRQFREALSHIRDAFMFHQCVANDKNNSFRLRAKQCPWNKGYGCNYNAPIYGVCSITHCPMCKDMKGE